jgi:glycosyltransferase involved in cell wall biosynthesis
LRRNGLSVDVLALTESGSSVHLREEVHEGGSDFHTSRETPPGMAAQRVWRLVLERHARQPYDWIVGFGAARPGHWATTFAAWLGCSSLVLVRGNDFDQDWFDPRSLPLLREALSRATVIGAVSPDMAQRLAALFPGQRVRFIPNGVDVAQWDRLPHEQRRGDEIRQRLRQDSRRVIGLFGEWKYKKRLPEWLSALRSAGLNEQVALLVVGSLDEATGQILDDPALSPVHERLPFTVRDELPGLYAACDFVALPSLYEGMPNVLLEAMASGVVPLVSQAGAMPELVRDGETGFVFPPEDRSAMACAIRRALTLTADEQHAMGQRARAFVAQHFSVERELSVLLQVFAEMRSGPSTARGE